MLKIRLQRVGRKNDPSFRVVVVDSRKGPKSNKYIEMLGSYNPRQKTTRVNAERIKYWLSVGACTSGTLHNILVNEKVVSGPKINVLPKKTPLKKEEADKDAPKKEEEAPAEEAIMPEQSTETAAQEAVAEAPQENAS